MATGLVFAPTNNNLTTYYVATLDTAQDIESYERIAVEYTINPADEIAIYDTIMVGESYHENGVDLDEQYTAGERIITLTYTNSFGCDSIYNIYLFVAGTSRIAENDDMLFNLYPNPATDKVTISAQTGHIQMVQLYNMNGALLKSVANLNESPIELGVSDLPTGCYFIRIQTDNKQMATQKLLKR